MAKLIWDVVVVNWNSGDALRPCLRSLQLYGGSSLGQVVVVDNASVDGSENCCSEFPEVKLLRARVNIGFGRACNLGAQGLAGEYILFLNPDAQLCAGVMDALIQRSSSLGREYGIQGVQIVDAAGHISRTCARLPSPLQFCWHALGIDRAFPRLGFQMLEWSHDSSGPVDHVMGSFFWVRRSLFDTLNGFDEDYFLYMEDLDFSNRARRLGFRSYFWADLQVFHEGGGCSKQVRALRLFYDLRSRCQYARKHFSPIAAFLGQLAMLAIEPCSRSLYALLRLSRHDLRETWIAQGMLLRWILHGGNGK